MSLDGHGAFVPGMNFLALVIIGLLLVAPASAAEPGTTVAERDQRAIESARDSLGGGWGASPWYDRATDAERMLSVSPRRQWNFNIWDLLQPLLWSLAFLFLGVLVFVAVREFIIARRGARRTGGAASQPALRADVGRVEALPFDLEKKPVSLLDEAERCYRAGNYSQAIVYLFSYQLLEMDKLHAIRLARGKTNRQYLRELGSRQGLRRLVEQTMVAFEHVFFGHHELPRPAFENCWRRLGEFERLAREGAPA